MGVRRPHLPLPRHGLRAADLVQVLARGDDLCFLGFHAPDSRSFEPGGVEGREAKSALSSQGRRASGGSHPARRARPQRRLDAPERRVDEPICPLSSPPRSAASASALDRLAPLAQPPDPARGDPARRATARARRAPPRMPRAARAPPRAGARRRGRAGRERQLLAGQHGVAAAEQRRQPLLGAQGGGARAQRGARRRRPPAARGRDPSGPRRPARRCRSRRARRAPGRARPRGRTGRRRRRGGRAGRGSAARAHVGQRLGVGVGQPRAAASSRRARRVDSVARVVGTGSGRARARPRPRRRRPRRREQPPRSRAPSAAITRTWAGGSPSRSRIA